MQMINYQFIKLIIHFHHNHLLGFSPKMQMEKERMEGVEKAADMRLEQTE